MIRWERIRLLVIDLDNTLCDTLHDLTFRQWNHVADVFARRGRHDVERVLRARAGKQSFVSVLKELDLSPTETKAAVKAYDHNDITPLTLFPDATPLLALPFPTVVLSRGEKALQMRKIRHLGIAKRIEESIVVTTFGSKEIALRNLLRRRKLPPSAALVIGDRVEEEIVAARRLRMPCVLIKRPDLPVSESLVKPDLVVRDLRVVVRKLAAANV